MSILQALVLGVVQGITEFLPISSSGHLVLLQKIFGIEEPVLVFDTFVHIGTLAAVCVVLRQDIWGILRKLFQPLTLFVIIATIPTVIAALLFKRQIETAFASASFLGFAFLLTSALLLLPEFLYRTGPKKIKTTENTEAKMTWQDALIIGLFQAVAINPGISRSGSTLSAGLFRGLKRDFAVRFSFLLSIPAILGALVFQIKDLGRGEPAGAAALVVGAISAAIVGFFSIRLMLKIVRERSLLGFAVYTGALGLLVLIDRFATHFFF
jgi:undecaprenyl-diphosphatase